MHSFYTLLPVVLAPSSVDVWRECRSWREWGVQKRKKLVVAKNVRLSVARPLAQPPHHQKIVRARKHVSNSDIGDDLELYIALLLAFMPLHRIEKADPQSGYQD